MIRVAVPKARLWGESMEFLHELGFAGHLNSRIFHHAAITDAGEVEAYALKLPDIASIVGDGLVDFAIVSDEWLTESNAAVVPLVPLCWYHARMCVLEPQVARVVTTPVTVATSFPNIAHDWSARRGAAVRTVGGSIEAFPGHLTDVAIDCVESGATAHVNGLVVAQELMRCDVWLVASAIVDLDTAEARAVVRAAVASSRDPRCTYGPRVAAWVAA